MMEERGSTEKTGGVSCPDPMDRIKKTTSTAFMPDGFSWPAAAAVCEAKRPGWLPFLSTVGLSAGLVFYVWSAGTKAETTTVTEIMQKDDTKGQARLTAVE
jgi:hypothetical protein